MKKATIVLLILFVFCGSDVFAKWFQQKSFYSQALQQDKTYFIGLPEGYNAADTATKYPVIVFLHGASVTAAEMVNTMEPYLNNFLGKLLFEKLFKVIFVIPDGSSPPYKGSFYTNSELYGNYEDYIAADLPAEIRANYKTYPYREKWSIMGHSMGGYGAMKIALKHPADYIGVASLSGPLNTTYFDELLPLLLAEHGSTPPYNFDYSGNVTQLAYSMAGAFSPDLAADPPIQFPVATDGTMKMDVMAKWESNNPINMIRSWKGNPATAVFTYCGGKDEFKLLSQNQMFSDSLEKYHLPHKFVKDSSGDHVTSLFTSMPQGINFLYQVMDTAQVDIHTQIEVQKKADVQIYPNPSTNQIFLSGNTENIMQVSFYNLLGQSVLDVSPDADDRIIDIHLLPKGIYLLNFLRNDGSTSVIRLIKR